LSGLSPATPLLISSGSQLPGKSMEAMANSSLGSFIVLAKAGPAVINESAATPIMYLLMI
jgi:hypothetical protein